MIWAIRFWFLKLKSSSEIDEPCMLYTVVPTVKNWFNDFQRTRTSVFDEPVCTDNDYLGRQRKKSQRSHIGERPTEVAGDN